MEKQLSSEQLENCKQILRDMSISNINQAIIQDNKIYFSHDKKSHRCEMPNQYQQSQAEDFKDTYKLKNIGIFPTLKQLKKDLIEKQHVDIDALEKQRFDIREEYQILALEGAAILSNETDKLEKYEKLIIDVENRLMDCLQELEEHLSTCLDRKVLTQYYRYLACVCTQLRTQKGEWKQVWESIDDFNKDNSMLPSKSIANVQSLILNTRD